jgi:hypothetical protein
MQQLLTNGGSSMFTQPSQKPFIEIAQVMTQSLEKTTRAYWEMANNVSKTYFDACSTCFKLYEENTQQSSKTGKV